MWMAETTDSGFCCSHNTLELEDCLRIGSHGYNVVSVCLFNSVKQSNRLR